MCGVWCVWGEDVDDPAGARDFYLILLQGKSCQACYLLETGQTKKTIKVEKESNPKEITWRRGGGEEEKGKMGGRMERR